MNRDGRGGPPPTRRQKRRGIQRFLRYAALWPLLQLLGLLPRPLARGLADFYAALVYRFASRLRVRALRHLELAYPEWTGEQRAAVAKGAFRWVGRTGVDFLRLGSAAQRDRFRNVRVEGEEHLQSMRPDRGVVVITAHFGNWEVLGSWLGFRGHPIRALYEPIRERRLDVLVRNTRSRGGVISTSTLETRALVRALRDAEWIGVLVDRVPRGASVVCRFFGRECQVAPGVARLARAGRALVLPAGLWEDANGRWIVRFWPPVEVPASPEGDAGFLARLTEWSEELVRIAPSQWPWFDDRWKRR